MIVIGLTGSFGTGKTFVASIFKRLGARVIDADVLARQALTKNTITYKKIVRVFGREILDANRNIDRKRLGEIVFNDKSKLNKLNRIIHPGVIRQIKKAVRKGKPEDAVVIDAPLLIEANLTHIVDKLIVVKASRINQIARCARKFGIERKDIINRIRAQIPLERKVALADYVVDNNGTKSNTVKQVKGIWGKLYCNKNSRRNLWK